MNVLEEDVSWLLQKGVVRVADWVIKNVDFLLGVRRIKAACMAAGVEGGKQVVRVQVATVKFTLGEPSAVVEHTQAMHASVKTFMDTNFTSYLRLGELNVEGFCRLCSDSDDDDYQPEGSSSRVGPPSVLLVSDPFSPVWFLRNKFEQHLVFLLAMRGLCLSPGNVRQAIHFFCGAYVMVVLCLKFLYFSSQLVYVGHPSCRFFPKVSVGLWGSYTFWFLFCTKNYECLP